MRLDSRVGRLFLRGIVISLLPVCGAFCQTRQPYTIGDKVTGIEGRTLEGNLFDPASLRGKYVFLKFWAAWCGPCMAEMPATVKLHKDLENERLAFVSISLDFDREMVGKAVRDRQIGFPVLFSGSGWDDPIARRFGVQSIPRNYILDPENRVLAMNLHGELLRETLTTLAEGRSQTIRENLDRAISEEKLLAEIFRLAREGKTEEAWAKANEFLETYPDSQNAYLARMLRQTHAEPTGSEMGAERSLPQPWELMPPGIEPPPGILFPGFAPSSPGRRAEGEIRLVARALEEYKKATGRYPRELQALAYNAAYLPKIPADPMGGALRYHTDGWNYWIIATNGPNGRPDIDVRKYTGDPAIYAGQLFIPASGSDAGGDIIVCRVWNEQP